MPRLMRQKESGYSVHALHKTRNSQNLGPIVSNITLEMLFSMFDAGNKEKIDKDEHPAAARVDNLAAFPQNRPSRHRTDRPTVFSPATPCRAFLL